MFDQAQALELAMRSSESYTMPQPNINAAVPQPTTPSVEQQDPSVVAVEEVKGLTCFFCGNNKHPRSRCPAREATCLKCSKKGHFAKVCRANQSTQKSKVSAAIWSPLLATVPTSTTKSLSKSSATVSMNGFQVTALFDSGSSESFIHPDLVEKTGLTVYPSSGTVSMATSALSSAKVSGACVIDLSYQARKYEALRVSVLPGLCANLILGLDFQSQLESVVFHYVGLEPTLSVFSTLQIEPPEPFANLTTDCHPIVNKSRRYRQEDSAFIDKEVKRLLEGIIEPSRSPWRAQVVVTKDENHKKRLTIDFSQTINRFTLLNAFPLPRMRDLVNNIAQYKFSSTIDLRSAYHQVPVKDEDKPYIAFEARKNVYQFNRLPFGITNGVACFQRE